MDFFPMNSLQNDGGAIVRNGFGSCRRCDEDTIFTFEHFRSGEFKFQEFVRFQPFLQIQPINPSQPGAVQYPQMGGRLCAQK